ncbi:hypothetical protein CYMTET_21117 [Cymbomonas tetramitiformis]|uniref:TRP C-terminal domain-containing protein n=1 Tax=Cymbomonas tetramitiformis TaxID=36881 RepID=A0AAE0G2Q6_9CHLO|nr:hypothetical protein CYMTET_21117 [Cymbomonas tetramitiformis]
MLLPFPFMAVVSGNKATNDGGGVSTGILSNVLLNRSSTVTGNEGVKGAGMSIGAGATIKLDERSVVADNSATNDGGGIWVGDTSAARVDLGSVISRNRAKGAGGGIFASYSCSVEVHGSQVDSNLANEGGGIQLLDDSVLIALQGAAVTRNTAQADAGGIYLRNADLVASNITVTHNTASGSGGGILIYNGALTMDSSRIEGNSANNEGGAIMCNSANLRLINITVRSNNATRFNGGGIAASPNSIINITSGSVIASNIAGLYGGGLFGEDLQGTSGQRASITMTISGTLLYENVAKYEGGSIYLMACQLRLAHSQVLGSTSDVNGGGICVRLSMLELAVVHLGGGTVTEGGEQRALAGNRALLGSGGAVFGEASSLLISNTTISGNMAGSGGGMFLVQGNGVAEEGDMLGHVIHTAMEHNEAGSIGGGVVAAGGAALNLSDVTIGHNHANVSAGGTYVSGSSRLHVTRSSLSQNSASMDGGAVYAEAGIASVAIEASEVRGNNASVAGGVCLRLQPAGVDVSLRGISFAANLAVSGLDVYWEHEEGAEEIRCAGCSGSGDNSTVVLATSIISHEILQDGEMVEGSVLHISGHTMDPPLVYAPKDFYGNIVSLVDAPTVAASIEVLQDDQALGSLLGSTSQSFVNGVGVTFSNLVLRGTPSETVKLRITTKLFDGIVVNVTLATCEAGQQYIESGLSCSDCKEGSIKFNNDSSECASCLETAGITCEGKAQYTLADGYWIPPAVQSYCESTVSSADGYHVARCVLAFVYTCDAEEACAHQELRRNNGSAGLLPPSLSQAYTATHPRAGEPVLPPRMPLLNASLQEEMLCAEGYRADVVLCSGCDVGYQESIKQYTCARCPLAGWRVRWQFGGVLAGLLSCLLLLVHQWRRMQLRLQVRMADMDMAALAAKRRKTSAAVDLLAGYFQVMGQLFMVMQLSSIPPVLRNFLSVLAIANINLLSWIGYRCLLFEWYGESQEALPSNPFYITFMCYAVMPFMLVLPCGWFWWVGDFSYFDSKDKDQGSVPSPAGGPTAIAPVPREEMSIAMHPLPGARIHSKFHGSTAESGDPSAGEIANPLRSEHPSSFCQIDWTPEHGCGRYLGEMTPRLSIEVIDNRPAGSTPQRSGRGGSKDAGGQMLLPPAVRPLPRKLQQRLTHRRLTVEELAKAHGLTSAEVVGVQKKHGLTLYLGALSFLLIFIHPIVSTKMFQIFYCDEILLDQGHIESWVHSDKSVVCGDALWTAFATIGALVISLYSIGLPLGLGIINFYLFSQKLVRISAEGTPVYVPSHRLEQTGTRFFLKASEDSSEHEVFPVFLTHTTHRSPLVGDIETKLEAEKYRSILGSFVLPFKRRYYYWMTYDIIRKLAQTSFVILVNVDSKDWGLVYSLGVSTMALAIQGIARPYQNQVDNFIQSLILFSQSSVLLIFVITEYIDVPGRSSMFGTTIFVVLQVFLCMYIVSQIIKQQLRIHKDTIELVTAKQMKARKAFSKLKSRMYRARLNFIAPRRTPFGK